MNGWDWWTFFAEKGRTYLTPVKPEIELAFAPGVLGFTLSPECFSSAADLSNKVRFRSKEARCGPKGGRETVKKAKKAMIKSGVQINMQKATIETKATTHCDLKKNNALNMEKLPFQTKIKNLTNEYSTTMKKHRAIIFNGCYN